MTKKVIDADKMLKNNYEEAEKTLNNVDELERLLQRLENKFKDTPLAGGVLAEVPIMASLLRSYINKEYRDAPVASLIAMIAAILYVVTHFDLIPDSIPVIGMFDDAAVVAAAFALVKSDIDEYKNWRINNNKII